MAISLKKQKTYCSICVTEGGKDESGEFFNPIDEIPGISGFEQPVSAVIEDTWNNYVEQIKKINWAI